MKLKKKLDCLPFSFCILALFSGCGRSTAYHSFRHIGNNAWNNRDTISFSLDSLPDNATYDFLIELRTNFSYPYQSIWLAVEREMRNPHLILRDTAECLLNNDRENRNLPGIHSHTHSIPLNPIPLYKGQTGRIRVIHLMRRETLPGISDVGLCVRRIENPKTDNDES